MFLIMPPEQLEFENEAMAFSRQPNKKAMSNYRTVAKQTPMDHSQTMICFKHIQISPGLTTSILVILEFWFKLYID